MDVIGFLEDNDINYFAQGKNISEGWIGTACMFCGDSSNHLGINLDNGSFNCWKCKEHGNFLELIKEIKECTAGQASSILFRYKDGARKPKHFNTPQTLTAGNRPPQGPVLPPSILHGLQTEHITYLKNRRFNPERIQKEYDLYCGWTIGPYRHRIIIPMKLKGEIVNFTSRAIFDKMEPRYKHCPNSNVKIQRNKLLYNIDKVKRNGRAIIVEGPTDVWRIGPGAVASMGTQVTHGQIDLLRRKKLDAVFVLFDPGAEKEANQLAANLSCIIKNVENLQLIDEEDPGSMSQKTRKEVLKLLGD